VTDLFASFTGPVFAVYSLVCADMFPSILSRAVKDKVGNSKVIQAFKDTYDYIIGMYLSVLEFSVMSYAFPPLSNRF